MFTFQEIKKETGVGDKEENLANARKFCDDFNLTLEQTHSNCDLLRQWVQKAHDCACDRMPEMLTQWRLPLFQSKPVFPTRQPDVDILDQFCHYLCMTKTMGQDRSGIFFYADRNL
ncbi:MAG: hypothetical protein GXP56_01630 [Deltaproteobacteria bacterium]|nr:hypothetical protein [Deltaproteobacteria bacterium]